MTTHPPPPPRTLKKLNIMFPCYVQHTVFCYDSLLRTLCYLTYGALCTDEDDDGTSRFSVDPDVSVKSTRIHIGLAVLSVELGLSDRQADAVAR